MQAKLIIEKRSLKLASLAWKMGAFRELGNSLFMKHTLYWLNAKKALAE